MIVLPIVSAAVPLIIHFATWIRQRRQARKHGSPLPPFDPNQLDDVFVKAGDLVDAIESAKTPAQTPKSKGLR